MYKVERLPCNQPRQWDDDRKVDEIDDEGRRAHISFGFGQRHIRGDESFSPGVTLSADI